MAVISNSRFPLAFREQLLGFTCDLATDFLDLIQLQVVSLVKAQFLVQNCCLTRSLASVLTLAKVQVIYKIRT